MDNGQKLVDAVKKQMLAALATLNQCIDNCPASEWDKSHNDAPFSQVLFHTLFYVDYYLSEDEHEFKAQPFHAENKSLFRDYEELEYKKAEEVYTKAEITKYMDFCYAKTNGYFEKAEAENLFLKSTHRDMQNIEFIIYITRHVQHHAAQLGLRIQQVTGKELRWEPSGWDRPQN